MLPKQTIIRNWRKLILALPAIIIGGILALLGNASRNPIIIVLGFGGLAIGVILIASWWRTKSIRVLGRNKELESRANSILVTPDTIRFIYLKHPVGWPKKLRNDGKYYYVNTIDYKSKKLVPFTIPDEKDSRDPTELANPLTMPMCKRYFSYVRTQFQKVSTIALAVVDIFLIIGLIAMS